jgi:hypothetical protein
MVSIYRNVNVVVYKLFRLNRRLLIFSYEAYDETYNV